MTRPVAIDLYCRMGGSTVGLQRAGFYVIGVDRDPQPGYPGDGFVRMDAIFALLEVISAGDLAATGRPTLIWAGPPCQEANTATAGNRAKGLMDDHEQLVPETRRLLDKTGIPYVIEQPTSSRAGIIRRDLTLCMDMFKGDMPPPWQQKHRSFELSGFSSFVRQPVHPAGPVRGPSMHGFPKPAGHAGYIRGHRHNVVRVGPYVAGYGKGGGKAKVWEMQHALGIDWMTDDFDLREAIPPAFSEFIGRAFLNGWA